VATWVDAHAYNLHVSSYCACAISKSSSTLLLLHWFPCTELLYYTFLGSALWEYHQECTFVTISYHTCVLKKVLINQEHGRRDIAPDVTLDISTWITFATEVNRIPKMNEVKRIQTWTTIEKWMKEITFKDYLKWIAFQKHLKWITFQNDWWIATNKVNHIWETKLEISICIWEMKFKLWMKCFSWPCSLLLLCPVFTGYSCY
jgi:hypothetical protein